MRPRGPLPILPTSSGTCTPLPLVPRLLASTPSQRVSLNKVPGGPDGFVLAGSGVE